MCVVGQTFIVNLFFRIVGEGSVGAGLVLLAYNSFLSVVGAVVGSGKDDRGATKRIFHLGVTLCYVAVAFVMFGVS